MANGNLRDELRALIEDQHLSDAERASLQAKARKQPAPRLRLWFSTAALAASLLLVLTVWLTTPTHQDTDTLWRVAEEVTTNHTRIKPLDVTDASFETLRAHLAMLDFSLQYPNLPDIEKLELIGGRYCTLQGVIATQLVFRDAQGNRITLYQAGYDPARFGPIPDLAKQQTPAKLVRQGLEIQVWQQSGVLLALAGSAG